MDCLDYFNMLNNPLSYLLEPLNKKAISDDDCILLHEILEHVQDSDIFNTED